MESDAGKRIYATVAFDRQGNIVEVRDSRGEVAREASYGQRKVGDECPEEEGKGKGKSKIKVIKNIEIESIVCDDTSDPCWYHDRNTCRWYRIC